MQLVCWPCVLWSNLLVLPFFLSSSSIFCIFYRIFYIIACPCIYFCFSNLYVFNFFCLPSCNNQNLQPQCGKETSIFCSQLQGESFWSSTIRCDFSCTFSIDVFLSDWVGSLLFFICWEFDYDMLWCDFVSVLLWIHCVSWLYGLIVFIIYSIRK